MRRALVWLSVALLCACGVAPARADEAAAVSPDDRRAIEGVIASQLDAFRRDAGDAAFGFASPGIQSMFGDAAHFMGMVRDAYGPVFRSRSHAFEAPTTVEDRVVQPVVLVGPDGVPVLALYAMEREPDGSWRIDGCTLTQPRRLTT